MIAENAEAAAPQVVGQMSLKPDYVFGEAALENISIGMERNPSPQVSELWPPRVGTRPAKPWNASKLGALTPPNADRLGPGNRARSLGRKKQWLELLALQLLRNDQTRMLHRERVKHESTAAPLRAA